MKPITLYDDAPLKMVFSPTYCRCYPIHTILHSTHKLFYRFPYDLFLDMFVSRCASQKERSPIDKTNVRRCVINIINNNNCRDHKNNIITTCSVWK